MWSLLKAAICLQKPVYYQIGVCGVCSCGWGHACVCGACVGCVRVWNARVWCVVCVKPGSLREGGGIGLGLPELPQVHFLHTIVPIFVTRVCVRASLCVHTLKYSMATNNTLWSC